MLRETPLALNGHDHVVFRNRDMLDLVILDEDDAEFAAPSPRAAPDSHLPFNASTELICSIGVHVEKAPYSASSLLVKLLLSIGEIDRMFRRNSIIGFTLDRLTVDFALDIEEDAQSAATSDTLLGNWLKHKSAVNACISVLLTERDLPIVYTATDGYYATVGRAVYAGIGTDQVCVIMFSVWLIVLTRSPCRLSFHLQNNKLVLSIKNLVRPQWTIAFAHLLGHALGLAHDNRRHGDADCTSADEPYLMNSRRRARPTESGMQLSECTRRALHSPELVERVRQVARIGGPPLPTADIVDDAGHCKSDGDLCETSELCIAPRQCKNERCVGDSPLDDDTECAGVSLISHRSRIRYYVRQVQILTERHVL